MPRNARRYQTLGCVDEGGNGRAGDGTRAQRLVCGVRTPRPFQASREHPATLQVAALGNLPPHPLPPPRAPSLPPSSGSALLPPLPPPIVAPLLPAAAAISARACISAQPRMLVPGQREGMEASLWPMSRPVPQLQSFRVISAMTRSPVSRFCPCTS